jgi:hypothetical protein
MFQIYDINRYVFIARYCFYCPFIVCRSMYCFYICQSIMYGECLIFAQETFSSTDTGFGIDPFGGRMGT